MRNVRLVRWHRHATGRRHGATPASSSANPMASTVSQSVSFIDFAKSARDDVSVILRQQEGLTWPERVDDISTLALDLWAREAPHWRVAGSLVDLPAPASSHSSTQSFSTSLAVDKSSHGDAHTNPGLGPASRARSLRALSSFFAASSKTQGAAAFMAALVDSGGVVGGSGGLAYQLELDELCRCIEAIAMSRVGERWARFGTKLGPHETAVKDFVQEAYRRLVAVQGKLALRDLHGVWVSFKHCNIDADDMEPELRKRLRSFIDDEAMAVAQSDVPCAVACARALGEIAFLKSPSLRRALLPISLKGNTAAHVLQHAMPLEGALSTGHAYVVTMAVGQIISGARLLKVSELSSAMHGVLALQAQGDDLAIQQAARVLRALWPRVCVRLPHMGPSSLGATLKAYFWQLLYSRQELSLTGISKDHPLVESVPESTTNRKRNQSLNRRQDSLEELKSKLMYPVLDRLSEMPLRCVNTCLTAIAPPVRPPDVLTETDRSSIRDAVTKAFPLGNSAVDKSSWTWWDDFWSGEVQQLTTSELLEMICSLRELHGLSQNEINGWWVMESLLFEVDQRLSSSTRERPSVELSHDLLLRMCRAMDIWQGHQVEGVLQHLLSSPDAMAPLPSAYFTAVITALCKWSVPKEIPMRLATAFLDRVDKGERVVDGKLWSEFLMAVQTLNEPTSGERITSRIIQHLVPHLSQLPAQTVAASLHALATKPPASESRPTKGTSLGVAGYSALEMAPPVALEAVAKLVTNRDWDFHQLVGVFESLGRLGWYSDTAARAVLAQCSQTPLLEAHAPLLLPLARTCVALRVHHAPLLHKMVLWYGWCYAYLREKPLQYTQLDELIDLADMLCQLSFQSLEMLSILAENLHNPNASPRQVLGLLSALARFAHFPSEFREACTKIGADSMDTDLASLSSEDLTNAFNIHLCGVFDGPAALKHWLTENEAMKQFFQVHTSQKWYQKQDQERTTFLQSPTYLTLLQAAEDGGLDLRPSNSGEVYHVELVERDAKDRLNAWSNDPPLALVCVKSKDQLRWYVPVTADPDVIGEQLQNRCERFRFMFRGVVQKLRHLQAMGYRPIVIWMSEWNALTTREERAAYLDAARSGHGQRSTAFSPGSEEDAYD